SASRPSPSRGGRAATPVPLGEESPLPENRAADAHMGRAERNRAFEIPAHAHRQFGKPVAFGDLVQQGEMRRRVFAEGRYAHQAGNCEAVFAPALSEKRIGILGQNTGLLRL